MRTVPCTICGVRTPALVSHVCRRCRAEGRHLDKAARMVRRPKYTSRCSACDRITGNSADGGICTSCRRAAGLPPGHKRASRDPKYKPRVCESCQRITGNRFGSCTRCRKLSSAREKLAAGADRLRELNEAAQPQPGETPADAKARLLCMLAGREPDPEPHIFADPDDEEWD
jgi:hypothetical protein